MLVKKLLSVAFSVAVCTVAVLPNAGLAQDIKSTQGIKGRTYNEVEFLKTFSGKSRQQVTNALGQPVRREQSVKPAGADEHVSLVPGTKKPINVEMWYYKNLVAYEKKKTYKTTELTFVNDHCANIAFFNDK